MILQSKYSPGDNVWAGCLERTAGRVPCPECLGAREWTVTTPAGNQITVDCPTCENGYKSYGWIEKHAVVGTARKLTIASVRYGDSYTADGGLEFHYFCGETSSNGSGTVHSERSLFETETEAEADGARQAAEQQAHVDKQNVEQRAAREKKLARLKKCNVCEGSGRLSIQRNER